MAAYIALIFLGVIVLLIVLLFVINQVAKTYLNGSYTEVPIEEGDVIDEITEEDDRLINLNKDGDIADDDPLNLYEAPKNKSNLAAHYREKYQKSYTNKPDSPFQPNRYPKVSVMKRYNTSPPRYNGAVDTENTVKIGATEKLAQKAQQFYQYTDANVADKIQEKGFDETFASNATVSICLQYHETNNILMIRLQTLEGLYLLEKDCPFEISFHFKIIPKNKFPIKTKWKPVTSKTLLLTHSVGPLTVNDMDESKLCCRLYGKTRKKLSRPKCYGECFIQLQEVLNKTEETLFEKRILPKASKSIIYGSKDSLLDG